MNKVNENLIIVESPTKSRTIEKFLNKGYKILSSYGHVRDLPKGNLGIDIDNNFEPKYVIPTKARKNATLIKNASKNSKNIILATDEDREGEAIAWHILKIIEGDKNIKNKNISRITFHEITENAIKNALKNPRNIDMNLVNAQQARRILDRIVGYKLSPFLWKKLAKGLSAGRVQSVALKLIVEREKEIKEFKPKEYWTINAIFKNEKSDTKFLSELDKIDNKKITIEDIQSKNKADALILDIKGIKAWNIAEKSSKTISKNPYPPFTTSTLQQESYKRLGFSSKQTMMLAQKLYEKGFITYMRTDSLNLSNESVNKAKELIKKEFGNEYCLKSPRIFKTKSKGAQEAHEAIRPTNPYLSPLKENTLLEKLQEQENRLYKLIWERFIASQMQQAKFIQSKIIINGKGKHLYIFKTTGSTLKFDGFLKVWKTKYKENIIPQINKEDKLNIKEVNKEQHFTQPPPRYNDATLIKTLEEYGIGRPSTYAPIISVIQERNYVFKNENKRFEPTEIGIKVSDMLSKNFQNIVNLKFTAEMEQKLDYIAKGKIEWKNVIKEFYYPFIKQLEEKYETVDTQKPKDIITDIKCEKCGKPMVIKYSKYGKFLACSGFPKCRNTKPLPKELSENKERDEIFGKCPKCKIGDIIKIRTKKGRIFYGCSRYPDCDFASWKNPNIDKDAKKQ